jgi:hypothetical protein
MPTFLFPNKVVKAPGINNNLKKIFYILIYTKLSNTKQVYLILKTNNLLSY